MSTPDPDPSRERAGPRILRWLPWLAAACAAGVIAATFWATQPSRTPVQKRVESVAVAGFFAGDGASADEAAYAERLARGLREYLVRTPGLSVPDAPADAERVVEGTVVRRGERWYVSVRILDAEGREVRSRTREWPVADGDALAFTLARDVTAALKLPPPKVEVLVR